MSGFLNKDIFEIKVQKTRQFYDKIISNDANIIKFVLSDDEIDYYLDLDDIYNLQFLEPITQNAGIRNQLIFDGSVNPQIVIDHSNITFDLSSETTKNQEINLTVSNGIEGVGFIIENNYQDFISIVNTGSITSGDKILTNKYVSSNLEILENTSRFQCVGEKFNIYITNNVNINQKLFQINIYSMTYPISTTLLVKY